MSIPQAIASGAAAETPDAVKPVRVGIGAGVLAALFLFAVYLVEPVPARMIELLGGPTDAFGRQGGLAMEWVPPPGVDMAATEARFAAAGTEGARLRRHGDVFVVEVPGVASDDIDEVAQRIGRGAGGLAFHDAFVSDALKQFESELGAGVQTDQWRSDDGGPLYTDYHLFADTRDALDALVSRARQLGWTLPPGGRIAYERIERTNEHGGGWRTYIIAETAALDGSAIASAMQSFDPNTNRPLVLVDFTPEAAGAFGELTNRITGKKLAIVVDGMVSSAPIINGRIAGGRASITMGGSDPMQQEHEAQMLTSVLRAALPAGGTVRAARHVPPGDTTTKVWISRIVVALGGGALVGLLAWAVIRAARPTRRRSRAPLAGAVPWTRIGVTLLAPVAVLVLARVPLFGLSTSSLDEGANAELGRYLNLGMLGLTPIITAFILVHLIALVLRIRASLTNAVIGLSTALVVIQSLVIFTYLEQNDLTTPTGAARASVMASLLAGTLVLAAVAYVIRRYGLGNGYGALIASGWIAGTVWHWLDAGGTSSIVLGAATNVAMIVPLAVALRWRVASVGEAPLRVPTSGIIPIADHCGVALLLVLLQTLPLESVTMKLYDLTGMMTSRTVLVILDVALVVIWSVAFARPGVLSRVASRASLAAPSRTTFRRATGLSIALLLFVVAPAMLTFALRPDAMLAITDPLLVGATTAVVLDIAADIRNRRGDLVVVWSLQQAQHVDVVTHVLAEKDIPHHLAGSHLRTLFAWFGPFAPIDVLVPAEHARAANTAISKLYAD